jgi:hypothetical protein
MLVGAVGVFIVFTFRNPVMFGVFYQGCKKKGSVPNILNIFLSIPFILKGSVLLFLKGSVPNILKKGSVPNIFNIFYS